MNMKEKMNKCLFKCIIKSDEQSTFTYQEIESYFRNQICEFLDRADYRKDVFYMITALFNHVAEILVFSELFDIPLRGRLYSLLNIAIENAEEMIKKRK